MWVKSQCSLTFWSCSWERETLHGSLVVPCLGFVFCPNFSHQRAIWTTVWDHLSFWPSKRFFSPYLHLVVEEVKSIPLVTHVSHIHQTGERGFDPVTSFISKTQVRTKGASSIEPIMIPSLGHTFGSRQHAGLWDSRVFFLGPTIFNHHV